MWRLQVQAVFLLACLAISTAAAPATPALQLTITLEHLATDEWQASYQFSQAVSGFRVYPSNLAFREHWQVTTPGIVLTETSEGGVLAGQSTFTELVLRFPTDSNFGPKTYVPMLPFSGGGAAIYSGHFSGEALVAGDWQNPETKFLLAGLPGEKTLLPDWINSDVPSYVYIGPQSPAMADDVTMILDTALPEWLRETLDESIPAVTAFFTEKLGHQLATNPLLFLAAGELHDYQGYSVKGGGLYNQFTIMLRGTDLLEESRSRQQMFEKMIAHELLHVWQQSMPGGAFNPDEPWLHEGSADALAVHALVTTGFWTVEEQQAFHAQQSSNCEASLNGSSLKEAAAAGNWDAVYSCGYLEFTKAGDPFVTFAALAKKAKESGAPYSQALLDSLSPQ